MKLAAFDAEFKEDIDKQRKEVKKVIIIVMFQH